MSTIRDLLGLPAVAPHNYSKAVPQENPDPTLLYGVELEIESARGDWVVPGMTVVEDGSLRNRGLEFITSPMTYSNLAHCMDLFFTKSKVTKDNYSERCSVHVHTNCQPLTIDQLGVLLLLYQVFERVLFRWIGDERDKNIFCVPWYETTLSSSIVHNLKALGPKGMKRWQKYTALNLLPLFEQGTVEFRHMAGTSDAKRIMEWCRIIGCLYAFAHKNDYEGTKRSIMDLNTNSHYRQFFTRVFDARYTGLVDKMNQQDMEEGVLQTKYGLVSEKDVVNPLTEKKIPVPQAILDEWEREEQEMEEREEEERQRPIPAPLADDFARHVEAVRAQARARNPAPRRANPFLAQAVRPADPQPDNFWVRMDQPVGAGGAGGQAAGGNEGIRWDPNLGRIVRDVPRNGGR